MGSKRPVLRRRNVLQDHANERVPYSKRFSFCTNFPVHTSHITQGLVVYAAKSNKVMYSITFVIFPVTKTIFSTRGCFSATLGLKMNIDAISLCTPHILRLPI